MSVGQPGRGTRRASGSRTVGSVTALGDMASPPSAPRTEKRYPKAESLTGDTVTRSQGLYCRYG